MKFFRAKMSNELLTVKIWFWEYKRKGKNREN